MPHTCLPRAKTSAEIEQIVKQLGSDSFADCEAASKALEAIGAPALDALRKVAADGTGFQQAGNQIQVYYVSGAYLLGDLGG